jgi:4-hydroxybenzoate polyprenyltransferase
MSRAIAAARPPLALLYARFLKIEHTVFSLPMIFAGTLLADPAGLTIGRAAWILLAGAGARTAAMGLNRIIDRKIDAANPRTAARELPSGALSLREAWAIVAIGVVTYLAAAALLSPLCLALSPIPLAVFVAYPYLKRVTPLCHLGVGAALGLAPLGGWLAAGPRTFGEIGEGLLAPLLLAAFTLMWVAGFDVIYATLDEESDRRGGIRSLPALLGRARALRVAALLHAAGVAALVALHAVAFGGLAALAAGSAAAPPLAPLAFLAATAVLLIIEHRSAWNVDLAFFKINLLVGIAVFGFVAAGVWSRG